MAAISLMNRQSATLMWAAMRVTARRNSTGSSGMNPRGVPHFFESGIFGSDLDGSDGSFGGREHG